MTKKEWHNKQTSKQDKIEDFKAREKQKHDIALQSSNKQLKAIEKHCFYGKNLTSNYEEIAMDNVMKLWKIRNTIKATNEELRLLSTLASDNEKDKNTMAMAIIEKSQRLAKKVDKYNEKVENWEKQSLSREMRDCYKPLKKYNSISNDETKSDNEKRKASNTFVEKMDKVFDNIKNKH